MTQLKNIIYCIILICLQTIASINAASSDTYQFNNSTNSANIGRGEMIGCIYKDSKGFMWLGGISSIKRFDGYELRILRDTISRSSEYIARIFETSDGRLWVHYRKGKNSVLDLSNCRFYSVSDIYPNLNITEINNVFPDGHGGVLYFKDGTLLRYDIKSTKSQLIKDVGKKATDIKVKDGFIYIVYDDGKIDVLSDNDKYETVSEQQLAGFGNRHYRIFVDSDNEIWIYAVPEESIGLHYFSRNNNDWVHYNSETSKYFNSSPVMAVEEDEDGLIWVSVDHSGLNLINKITGEITVLRENRFDDRSIKQNSVCSLYKDDEGIMWCGTYKNGVCYYHKNLYKFDRLQYPITQEDNISDINDINATVEIGNDLWIGTNGAGLLRYNREQKKYTRYTEKDGLSSNTVICLESDRDGNLWIGSYLGGLDCFDGKSFRNIRFQDSPIMSQSVYSLLRVNDELYIGTLGAGLYCYSLPKKTLEQFSLLSEIPKSDNKIYALSYSEKDGLYIGTPGGLVILNTKTKHLSVSGIYDVSDNLALHTMPIFVDSRGLVWVCDNSCLKVFDSDRKQIYLVMGADTKSLYTSSINEDENGNIWVGTMNGLFRVAVNNSDNPEEIRFVMQQYTVNDGLPGNLFNGNSTCYTANKELLFGTTEGLTIFKPSAIKYFKQIHPVVFTSLSIDGHKISPKREYKGSVLLDKDISETEKLTIPYKFRNFSLNVSALDYLHPNNISYYYKIEGLNSEWIKLSPNNRLITMTNLPAGTYRLKIMAKNNEGGQTTDETSMSIRITPPFYLSYWFYFIYLLLASVIVYVIMKRVLHIQKMKQEEQQRILEVEQTHKMDQTKLRFLMNISHEFKTPLTLILAPVDKLIKEETDENKIRMFRLIHQNADRLLRLVNQLLDFRKIDANEEVLNLSSSDIVLFIRNISYSFSDLAAQKNIKLMFSSIFPSMVMEYDSEKMFKVISNLLSNAFKFTPENGSVSVSLSMSRNDDGENMLLISVKDTGRGIAKEHLSSIFERFYQEPNNDDNLGGTGIGLHICDEYVRLHNGAIDVKSEVGVGSEFTVAIPIIHSNISEVVTDKNTEKIIDKDIHKTDEVDACDKKTICVVDDNGYFIDFMKEFLAPKYKIITASDGAQAWELVQKELPDMVISDVVMPMTDGLELCKLIKTNEKTSNISVILLSAISADVNTKAGLEYGADDYITKPFNSDILMLKISKLLGNNSKLNYFSSNAIALSDVDVTSEDMDLMENIILYIESHISDPSLSVPALSTEMGMSRGSLYKKISQITRKTPIELIRTIRIKRAAQLFDKSQKRVSEVMYDVGINDIKLFRKYFKDEFGVLPSEYIENIKNKL